MSRSPLLAPRMTRPALEKVHWQRARAPRPWRAAFAAKKPRRRLPVDRMARVQTRIDQWVADVRTAPRGRVMRRRLAHCCCPLGVSTRPSGPLSTAVRFRAHRPPPVKRSRDGPTHAMQSMTHNRCYVHHNCLLSNKKKLLEPYKHRRCCYTRHHTQLYKRLMLKRVHLFAP